MRCRNLQLVSIIGALTCAVTLTTASAHDNSGYWDGDHGYGHEQMSVQLGPRPFYLVDKMKDGSLKRKLQSCSNGPFRKSLFSIGHRGAALQFPEHTRESYLAAARMGAGIIECDVTFTKDAELVCRHAQCDLHTTTNILATPLAAKCSKGFAPAEFDANGNLIKSASAKCCASDLTLEEFKSLKGKMDASNSRATTVQEYMGGTADFRTDLYAAGATLMTHKESIELFTKLGVSMTPELKGVDSEIGFDGVNLTQETYARKMIKAYIDAGISPKKVWPQSFDFTDVKLWIREFPRYGQQGVFLVDADNSGNPTVPRSELGNLRNQGLKVIAPAMPVLLTVDGNNNMAPSVFAKEAKRVGLDIIAWTSERSGRIVEDVLSADGKTATFYYSTVPSALSTDGDILTTIDALARRVGIIGLFSDWPATTTYYANCMGLK
jgi:glycerophosphoryl diester phosphodiesterase